MTQKSLLHAVAAQIANGYETAEVPMYSEQLRMPDRKVIIKIIENLQKVFFPAYFAGGTVSHVSAETFAEFLLGEIYTDLCEQVHLAFSNTIKDESELRERTSAVCDRFLCRLPQIQAMLMKDVAANFDGDPAAGSKEEVIFSYPGLYAIFVYRVAHELYESKVPLIPRIMSEYAHGATGIDINPGAQIGEYFFIDHGTGIVVGETTIMRPRQALSGRDARRAQPAPRPCRDRQAPPHRRRQRHDLLRRVHPRRQDRHRRKLRHRRQLVHYRVRGPEHEGQHRDPAHDLPRRAAEARRREIRHKQENTAGRPACGVFTLCSFARSQHPDADAQHRADEHDADADETQHHDDGGAHMPARGDRPDGRGRAPSARTPRARATHRPFICRGRRRSLPRHGHC